MYAIKRINDPVVVRDGHLDLKFTETQAWADNPHPGTTGGKVSILLLGDAHAGPLLILTSFPPMTEETQRGPAHAHDSDNWRISILGETNMGKDRYGPGEFRFQNGGMPYPSDNLAWGPDGGYGIVMMADRRGFPVRPVKKELVAPIDAAMRKLADAYGVAVADPYPAGPGVVTTIGVPDKAGKIEGSFADGGKWPEVVAGTRVAVGLLGERTVGPVLMLLQADPDTTALPACTFDTEVLLVMVDGSCRIGDDQLGFGDLRLQEAGAPSDAVVAGPQGLSAAVLAGDRRAFQTLDGTAGSAAQSWAGGLADIVTDLSRRLPADSGPVARPRTGQLAIREAL